MSLYPTAPYPGPRQSNRQSRTIAPLAIVLSMIVIWFGTGSRHLLPGASGTVAPAGQMTGSTLATGPWRAAGMLRGPQAGAATVLPEGLYPALLGAEEATSDPAYLPRVEMTSADGPSRASGASGVRYMAANPSQRFVTVFATGGVRVSAGQGRHVARLGLELSTIGYGDHQSVVAPTRPMAHGKRVVYAHGGLQEWYLNGPLGLEQGFTLATPRGKRTGQPLVLSLALHGAASARLAGEWLMVPGTPGLRYGSLYAYDAHGRHLPARLEPAGRIGGTLTLRLVVADQSAIYPLTIDPIVQLGTLSVDTIQGVGDSVSLSADGSVALVGVVSNYGVLAYIFQRGSSGWGSTGNPTAILSDGSGLSAPSGGKVALSADGSTAVVAAHPPDHSITGTADVYVRGSSGWASMSAPTARLTVSGLGSSSGFAGSVATNSDGTTILVGASGAGGAYVFTRGAGGWTDTGSPAAVLTANGPNTTSDFGYSVALSGNGSIALVGADGTNNSTGSVYVFTAGTGGWSSTSTPTATLTVSGLGANSVLGQSVALSADGSTALASARGANNNVGSAFVFAAGAGGWSSTSTPTATLTVNGLGSYSNFGVAVALSGDGSTALVGADYLNNNTGGAYLYTESPGGWTSSSSPLVLSVTGLHADSYLGAAMALSADGSMAMVGKGGIDAAGGLGYDTGIGDAYVYAKGAGAWSSTGSPTADLTVSGVEHFGFFGEVVLSADGSTALVGAAGTDSTYGGLGAAYLFVRGPDAWSSSSSPTTILKPPSGEAYAKFGTALALSADGSTVVVGAAAQGSNSGYLHIYLRGAGGWSSISSPSATLTGGGIGVWSAISADGSTVLAGVSGTAVATASLFVRGANGWSSTSTPTATLTINSQGVDCSFATSVALSNDGGTAVVSGASNSGYSCGGGSFVFTEGAGGWSSTSSPTAVLTGATGAISLSGDGSTVLAGGNIYVRGASGWGNPTSSSATLSPGGNSVALSSDGSTALIGDSGVNQGIGAAYLFERGPGGWVSTSSPTYTLSEPNPGYSLDFGHWVTLSGDGGTAMVGAGLAYDFGAVFIFDTGLAPSPTDTPTATPTNTATATTTLSPTPTNTPTSGAGWVRLNSSSYDWLKGISCSNPSACFAVGDTGAELYTTNGGASWAAQNSGTTTTLYSVSCATWAVCISVGLNGTIQGTSDGGAHWGAQTSGTSSTLHTVSCPSSTNCIAFGNNGTILTTANDGGNWVAQNSRTSDYFYGGACPSLYTCIAVGGNGTILVTTNGGSTWNAQISRTGATGSQAGGGSIWSTKANGTAFWSKPGGGGEIWATQASGVSVSLRAAACPTVTTCFVVGDNGTIVATTNRGASWTTEQSGTSAALLGVSCVDTSTCYVVGAGGVIVATTNGGASWSAQTSGTAVTLYAASCTDNGTCYADGDAGTILRRTG